MAMGKVVRMRLTQKQVARIETILGVITLLTFLATLGFIVLQILGVI